MKDIAGMSIVLYVSRRGYKISDPLKSVGVEHQLIYCDGDWLSRLKSFKKYMITLGHAEQALVITDTAENIGILAWAGAKVYGVPMIFRARGDLVTECRNRKQWFHEYIYRKIFLPYYSHVIPVSYFLLDSMISQHLPIFGKNTVINTPQDLGDILPNDIRYDIRKILIVTSFEIEQKTMGLAQQLGSLDLVLDDMEDYTIDIVGGGKYLKHIVSQAQGLRNISRITFHGYIKNVDRYYKNAYVSFYASGLDTFPSVINEARAYGLPVITTASQGMQEQIEDRVDGFFVKDIAADMVDILLELEKPARWAEVSEKGLETVRNKYAAEIIGTHFLRVIEKIREQLT